jgi:hypothetical protein
VREAQCEDPRVRNEDPSRSIALGANRRAALVGLALVPLLALSADCSSTSNSTGACPHSCDLAQTVRVEVSGGTPAEIMVTGPCGGGGTCIEGGCVQIDVYLKNTSSSPAGDGGPDLVCRVTLTSTTGQTAEAELTARYTAAACCSGYEFPTTTLALSFGADGSTGAASDTR